MEQDEVSVREAAELLRCSTATVRNYYHAGRIAGREEPRGVLGAVRLWLRRESVEALAEEAQRLAG